MALFKVIHNSPQLREWLRRDVRTVGLAAMSEFHFNEELMSKAEAQLTGQHPRMTQPHLEIRAAHLLLAAGHPGREPSEELKTRIRSRIHDYHFWKVLWAVAVIIILLFLATRGHAQNRTGGIILQPQNHGTTLATRGGGLFTMNCSTNMTCTFTGNTMTLTSTGGGGSGCVPSGGTANALLYDTGSGNCDDVAKITWNNGTTTLLAVSGLHFDFTSATDFKFKVGANSTITANGTLGQVLESNADGTFTPADPLVSGITAHDAVGTSTNPVLIGGYASAAAPSDVSADGDATRSWVLRNGALAVNLTAAGALIPGDATNGLKVQVATMPVTHVISDSGTITAVTAITNALPAGSNVIGHVIADTGSTTAVTGNVTAVQPTGTNLHAVLDTTSTTAVTQATGTNLHAVLDTTSTTAVTQATGTNLHAVLDTTSTTAVTQATATNLNAAVVGTGTAGTPAGNILTVQGVASMTKLLVTPDSVALPANQSVNVAQVAGNTTLTGNGATGTGSQRVTIASDNTAFSVNATLAAETTKVIGTVRNLGNAGGIFDTTQNAAVAANSLLQGCNFTSAPATVTTANQGAVQCNSKGELLTQLTDGTTNVAVISGTNALKTDLSSVAGTATVTAGVSGMIAVGGNTATNVAITSDPVLIGAQAVSSENAAVTTARGVQLVADLVGKLIVLPYANPENFVNGTTAAITDTTSTSVIASAGGSLRNYITQATVSNSHATVGTFVKLLEGTNIIWECYAAAVGGGCAATFLNPLRGAAATAINCQPVTTGANVICSASGFKGI